MVEIIFLTSLSIIPGCIWLMLFVHEDWRHPEPRSLIAFTFLAGMTVTLGVVLSQQVIAQTIFCCDITQLLFDRHLSLAQINFLIVFSAIEEIAKFAVVWFLIRPRKAFDEPLDAMIYMIVAGLGFAVVENIMYTSAMVKGTLLVVNPAQTILLRALGSTLLHALTSAVIGYYWAREMLKSIIRRYLPEGIALAILLHALFNYLIISAGEKLILPFLFLAIVLFFVLIDFERIKHKEHLI